MVPHLWKITVLQNEEGTVEVGGCRGAGGMVEKDWGQGGGGAPLQTHVNQFVLIGRLLQLCSKLLIKQSGDCRAQRRKKEEI